VKTDGRWQTGDEPKRDGSPIVIRSIRYSRLKIWVFPAH
jgi:hypothetical protein